MKKIGVFKYDLFPKMTCHKTNGAVSGDYIECPGVGRMRISSLIYVFNGIRAKKAENAIEECRKEYRKRIKLLESELLNKLYKDYPELKRGEE